MTLSVKESHKRFSKYKSEIDRSLSHFLLFYNRFNAVEIFLNIFRSASKDIALYAVFVSNSRCY